MSPSAPRISVIVPAFNSAQWIADTLESIRAQTFTDWEALVADDASSDGTARIVEEMALRDSRIRRIALPHNSGGPATPRNIALAQARSEWIAFCDADDLWHPQKLDLQLRVAQSESADLVCSGIRDFSPPAHPRPNQPINESQLARPRQIRLWQLLAKNTIPGSSVLCRRRTIADAGGFDPARELVAVEDYDLWLRVLENGSKVVKMDTPLVDYRRLPGSLSARKTKLVRRVIHVLRRHFERRRRSWIFPLAIPFLLASYGLQAIYLRVWRGRL